MNKLQKKLSLILIGTLATSMILTSCATTKGVKEDVKKGAEDVTQGVKEGANDVKKGAEDITGKAPATTGVVGTWKGEETNKDHYKLTLFEDSTYEEVILDKSDTRRAVYSGKYTHEGDKITLNREKKMEDDKTVEDKKVDKLTYKLENEKLIINRDNNKKEEIKLDKESSLAERIIK